MPLSPDTMKLCSCEARVFDSGPPIADALLANIFNVRYMSLLSLDFFVSCCHTSDLGVNGFLGPSSRLRGLVADWDYGGMTRVYIKVFVKILQGTVGRLRIQKVYDRYEKKIEGSKDYTG